MKKGIFIAIFLGFTVVSPVYAQVATTTPQTTHDAYISALTQLITLLEQQVASLVSQLQSISNNQATITTQLQTIAQNTTPIAPNQPVFGGIPDAPVDQSAIVINGSSFITPQSSGYPFGEYIISVEQLDTNGKSVNCMESNTITATSSDDGELSGEEGCSVSNTDVYSHQFTYIPDSSGQKTLTFNEGNLTVTTTVNVGSAFASSPLSVIKLSDYATTTAGYTGVPVADVGFSGVTNAYNTILSNVSITTDIPVSLYIYSAGGTTIGSGVTSSSNNKTSVSTFQQPINISSGTSFEVRVDKPSAGTHTITINSFRASDTSGNSVTFQNLPLTFTYTAN